MRPTRTLEAHSIGQPQRRCRFALLNGFPNNVRVLIPQVENQGKRDIVRGLGEKKAGPRFLLGSGKGGGGLSGPAYTPAHSCGEKSSKACYYQRDHLFSTPPTVLRFRNNTADNGL
jgi:hypothetical protein